MTRDEMIAEVEWCAEKGFVGPRRAKALQLALSELKASAPADGDEDVSTPAPMEQLEKAEQRAEALREMLATERRRLAACMHAALANTDEAVEQRLTANSPYWSASYQDVCDAVDREMRERGRAEKAEQQRDEAIARADQLRATFAMSQSEGERAAIARAERAERFAQTVQDERAQSFEALDRAVGGTGLTPYQPEIDICIQQRIETIKAEAIEFVTLANTIWTADRDGRAARRLAHTRMRELATRIAALRATEPQP
jgi:hypothetical protein